MIIGNTFIVDGHEVSFGQRVTRETLSECCSLNCANAWSRREFIPIFKKDVLDLTKHISVLTEHYKHGLSILSETHKLSSVEMIWEQNMYMDKQLEEKTIEEIAIMLKCDPTRKACMDTLLKDYLSIEVRTKRLCLDLKIAKADFAYTKGLLARESREVLLSKNLKLRNLWGEKLEIDMDNNDDKSVGCCATQIHRAMDDGYIDAFCS
jgi:hypothetical protein